MDTVVGTNEAIRNRLAAVSAGTMALAEFELWFDDIAMDHRDEHLVLDVDFVLVRLNAGELDRYEALDQLSRLVGPEREMTSSIAVPIEDAPFTEHSGWAAERVDARPIRIGAEPIATRRFELSW